MKEGWQTDTLGNVAAYLNRGVSPKYLDQGGICVLGQRCVRNHRIDYAPSRRHNVDAKKVSAERFVQSGDVLVNSTGVGSLGRVAQVRNTPPEPTTVDSHVTIVRPKPDEFFLDFFGYMMMTIEDAITEAGEGCGGQTELARKTLAENFTVSYPTSLPEQQRIVAILDEAFEGIATARANAEKNLGNARAIFENQRDIVFESLREDWAAQPLGELAAFRNGINYTKGSKGECIRILGVKDFRNSFDAPVDNLDTVVINGELSEQDALQMGDIVVVRSNGNVELIGRSLLVGELPEKTSHSGFTIRVRLSTGGLLPKYFCHFMKSSAERRRLVDGGIGTNIKSLNQGMLSSLTVPLPPLASQSAVVVRLDCLCSDVPTGIAMTQVRGVRASTLNRRERWFCSPRNDPSWLSASIPAPSPVLW